jgi:predicted AAA+ superfamily ATPase
MSPVYAGALLEAFVEQELFAVDLHHREALYFWVREEKGSSSELDVLLQMGEKLVPVEVKSGSQGSLKSLHQFLHKSKRNLGVRAYNGLPELNNFTVNLPTGESLNYRLLSIPCYLIFRLAELIS